MNDKSHADGKLAIAVELAIDQCCGRFEQAWAAGETPAIDAAFSEPHIDRDDGEARRRLLVELVLIDLEYRWRAGGDDSNGRWRIEDYAAKWPELLDDGGNPAVELMRQEFRVRRLAGDAPDRAEYRTRFPGIVDVDAALSAVERRTPAWMQAIGGPSRRSESQAASAGLSVRCPHCRDAVTVVADSLLADISCEACGRRFSLVGDDREGDERPPLASVAHFEFLERLGVGGFGTVWRARDTRLDRLVAVKIPRKGDLNSAESQQFLREARSAAQLRHPHIVSVHEVGREGETIYIVSDYVRGQPLSKRLEAGALSQRDAATLAAKLADALAHAHAMGIVHRDLKPANIMLDEAAEPHVMDFGLAKRDAGEMTMTVDGNILGTPAYMPPEQARSEGHRADRRSDVYSLGVILFEMLTGELPFRGSTQMLIAQILGDEPPSPRKLDRNLSRDLETICLKCLEKEPPRRYQAAGELTEELRRFLRGEPILARPVSGAERVWRWCRRRPLVASLGGTLAAVVLAVAIVAPIVAAYQSKLRSDAETLAGDLDVSLDGQRKQTDTANRLRGEAETLNAGLKRAIDEKDRQFRRANSLRLAAQAKSLVEESPQLSVLLAAAALQSSRALAESETETRQSLYDVLAEVSGVGAIEHSAAISAIDASSDGRWCVSGDRAGVVKLWRCDAGSDGERIALAAFEKGVVDVRFMSDARHLVAAASDGAVRVFDVASGNARQPIRDWKCGSALRGIDVSNGNRVAAACHDGQVRLWEFSTESEAKPRVLACTEMPLRTVALQPDDNWLAAAGDDGTVYVWNLTANSETAAIRLIGHEDVVQQLRFSPNGRWLCSCGNDRTVRLWNVEAIGKDTDAASMPVLLAGHGGAVRDAAFSADSRMVATAGSDGVVRVWEKGDSDWVPRHELTGHKSIVRAVVFSADGKRLVSASEDRTLRVWKLDATRPERSSGVLRGHERGVVDLAFLGDGRRLVSASIDSSLRFYDDIDAAGAGAAARIRHPSAVRGVCFVDGDGKRVASGTFDGGLYLWSPFERSGEPLEPMDQTHSAAITQLASNSDRSVLAAASADGRVSVWRLSNGRLSSATPRLAEHGGYVSGVAFDPDGRQIASTCYDGALRRWKVAGDAPLEAVVLRESRRPLLAVAVDPLGRWVASADERGVIDFARFGEAATGAASEASVPATIVGRTMITSLAVSPDGRWLFSGDFQGTIRRWDLQAGSETRSDVFRGHEKAVTSLSVSPNGRVLLSAGPDGTARLWDLASPRPAATGVVLRGHGSAVFAAAVSHDGRFAATSCDDRFVRLWHLRTDELLDHARRVAGRALSATERRTYQLDAAELP